ncbi:MAG: hypothetical protein Q9219_001598 [cf. Caloplaca sp. 3 TL-2023]
MANVLTQIQSALTQLPQCAVSTVSWRDTVTRYAQTTLSVARQLCLAAIPSLTDTRGGELVATVAILMVIATVAVILRLLARRVSASKLGTDDYLIILALFLTYGVDINSFYSIKAGAGRHLITLSLDQVTSFIKLSDVSWTSISVGVWVDVECNIGILSACLPILRPLFSKKYSSSPISYISRIIHTITNSSHFSSSRGDLSSDPEKGATASEPSSDATMVEGLKWPHDPATGWRWSRNNSESTAFTNPRPPPPGGRRTDAEKERKYKTWYTAAADILPEIDFPRRKGSTTMIDSDQIPRYRDDVVVTTAPEKPLPDPPPPPNAVVDEGEKIERGEQRLEVWQQRHSDALRAPSQHGAPREKKGRSGASSQRSSWGLRRDTWNLMPSVVHWDKGGIGRAMDLR